MFCLKTKQRRLMDRTIRRVFHPWSKREEFKPVGNFEAGMWTKLHGIRATEATERAKTLMMDSTAFERAMLFAIQSWPLSSEHNLSAVDTNRRAWLGHAGCFVVAQSPEETTRLAWHQL